MNFDSIAMLYVVDFGILSALLYLCFCSKSKNYDTIGLIQDENSDDSANYLSFYNEDTV
jgi:hypothetical protein